jgi:hypothetical protein
MFGSSSAYVWEDQPNEIWTVYHYSPFFSDIDRAAHGSVPAISVLINGDEMETQRFLADDTQGLEVLWRNNNSYLFAPEISSMSDIDIQGLSEGDEIIWVSLDRDDGSSPPDYAVLCSAEAPIQPGTYCLIIRHSGDAASEHQNLYFTLFVRLT